MRELTLAKVDPDTYTLLGDGVVLGTLSRVDKGFVLAVTTGEVNLKATELVAISHLLRKLNKSDTD